jgi:hypothetical protein
MITYNFIKYLILNTRYTKILIRIYKEEQIPENLSKLFNSNFKIDWVGRLYTVINPNLLNGEYDTNTQIFEYGEKGLTNEMFIERYIMQKLNIASNYIKANNLFDLLTYKIEKIDEYDNYLFIIEPITFNDFVKNAKKFCILILSLIVIGITLFLTFKYI